MELQKYPIIGDVRGKGLMVGAEIVKDAETKERVSQEVQEMMDECFKCGLTSGKCTMRFAPPLIITRELMDSDLEIFEGALKETAKQLS